MQRCCLRADEVNIMMPRPEYEALLESMMQACQAGPQRGPRTPGELGSQNIPAFV